MSAWPRAALVEVASIERRTVQPNRIKAGTTYVGLEHIDSSGAFVGPKPVDGGVLESSKFEFTDRHVLYGKLRPYLAKIACPEFAGICSTDILPILPGPKVERRFLFHFLRQPRMVAYASSLAVGVNLPRLSPSTLAAFEIPVPPIAEQRRIAEVLDRAEALRAKRRAALAQLDALAEAIFLDLFRAPEAQDWPEPPIASLAAAKPDAIRTGPFGSQLLHSEFVESGIAVLGIDNAVQNEFVWARPRFITDRKYRQLQRYTVFPEDVLITIMGTCGRCAVVPEGIPAAINTKHLCCIMLDQTCCLPVYLQACFLLHPKVLHRLGVRERGAVMPGLNMQIIKELRVPLPPLTIQREFIQRVEMVKNLKASQGASLGELDGLFASLQHRAFRGEL